MKISEIATKDVVSVDKGATLIEVAKLMRENQVGDVVIVEMSDKGDKPVGIITDRDIVVEIIAEEVAMDEITVGDAMSYRLVSVHENASFEETITQMRDQKVRRVPLVNDDGVLTGIISADDVFRVLAMEFDQLSTVYGIKQ